MSTDFPTLGTEAEAVMVYHEKQDGMLCARHCLNNLLQGPYFTETDLGAIAVELDKKEAALMGAEYASVFAAESHNVDMDGNFSVEVIRTALKNLDISMNQFGGDSAMHAMVAPEKQRGYICNLQAHWFAIRRISEVWYDLNSLSGLPETDAKPTVVSDFYLSAYLSTLQQSGYSIYSVAGTWPGVYTSATDSLTRSLSVESDDVYKWYAAASLKGRSDTYPKKLLKSVDSSRAGRSVLSRGFEALFGTGARRSHEQDSGLYADGHYGVGSGYDGRGHYGRGGDYGYDVAAVGGDHYGVGSDYVGGGHHYGGGVADYGFGGHEPVHGGGHGLELGHDSEMERAIVASLSESQSQSSKPSSRKPVVTTVAVDITSTTETGMSDESTAKAKTTATESSTTEDEEIRMAIALSMSQATDCTETGDSTSPMEVVPSTHMRAGMDVTERITTVPMAKVLDLTESTGIEEMAVSGMEAAVVSDTVEDSGSEERAFKGQKSDGCSDGSVQDEDAEMEAALLMSLEYDKLMEPKEDETADSICTVVARVGCDFTLSRRFRRSNTLADVASVIRTQSELKGELLFIAPPTLKWPESSDTLLSELVTELGPKMQFNVRQAEES